MSQLTGKAALVTGGSRGIGAAIAKRLAADGADVAITYAKSADRAEAVVGEIKQLGRRAIAIAADSGDAAAIVAAVQRTVQEFGYVDILVNNAGMTLASSFDESTPAEIDRLWNVNVRAVILASQAAQRNMRQGGRIINIGSCLGERVAWPGITLYSMTKAALIGLTRGLARDLGTRGITVNVVEPGPIDTEMNPASGAHADGQRAATALGHYGTPNDIANTVAHLAGETGRLITGAAILVDGGYAA
jgi:NAD(P)-dependent dehydrogenase (short-subunit alcohol dehydrogenase family)